MMPLQLAIGGFAASLRHCLMDRITPIDRSPQSLAAAIAARYNNQPDCLLEILHDLQDELHHVPDEALPVLAQALNLSRAEVYGVVTFYHDFHREPHGRHVIKVCRAEACQSMNGRRLIEHLEKRLNARVGEMTADSKVSIEATYCLGLCATGPAIMVDGKPLGRMTPARLDKVLSGLDK
jgi:formate dehydrogenase subunit gamma